MKTTQFRTTVIHRPMTPERRAMAIAQHLMGGGVIEPRSVQAAHAAQRGPVEPPKPWSLAIAKRNAAHGQVPAPPRCTCEPPKPWSLAIARRAREGQ